MCLALNESPDINTPIPTFICVYVYYVLFPYSYINVKYIRRASSPSIYVMVVPDIYANRLISVRMYLWRSYRSLCITQFTYFSVRARGGQSLLQTMLILLWFRYSVHRNDPTKTFTGYWRSTYSTKTKYFFLLMYYTHNTRIIHDVYDQ